MRDRLIALPVTLTIVAIAVAASASGQPARRFHLGASLGSHVQSADAVGGGAAAFGVVAGIGVTPWLDLEFEAARPADSFSREYTGTSVSFADRDASYEEIERLAVVSRFTHERQITSTLSAGVLFHPAAERRLSPRLFVGVTNHRARERLAQVPIRLPEGVDPDRLKNIRPHEERYIRQLGAITLGGSVAVAITRDLAIAPDLRFDYGSIGDEINNVLRTSVRIMWSF